MYTIQDILKKKGTDVTTIDSASTVLQAASLMNDKKHGALLVVDKEGRLIGIFSERDLLRRVVALNLDPAQTKVAQAMTREVVTCTAQTPVSDAKTLFKDRRIRHLPVLDAEERIAGLISIGDVNAWKLDGQEVEIQHLHEYLYGVA